MAWPLCALCADDHNGQGHVPGLERSYGSDHVSDALGLTPPGPVNLGQIIPGFGNLVSSILVKCCFPTATKAVIYVHISSGI